MTSDIDASDSPESLNHQIASPHANGVEGAGNKPDDQLILLRELILGSYQDRIADLNAEIVDVQAEMGNVQGMLESISGRIDDEEALLEIISPHIASSIRTSIQNSRPEMIEAISPIMADTLRTGIRESRGEMVEALYPIMGQLVQRSVREAMKDLARRIDQQIQSRFSITRQIRALVTGVSVAELTMRDSLPFRATDVFLIHRHSGLLLIYVNNDIIELNPEWASHELADPDAPVSDPELESDTQYDSDLISGMLTAIRDFVHDAFGHGENENLDQVTYGDQEILIETAEYAYMAVVVEGTQPSEYRSTLRNRLIEIENAFIDELRDYDGDATPFESTKGDLQGLLQMPEKALSASNSQYASKPIATSSNNATTDHKSLNSTSLNPLSILLIINIFIIIIWWLTQ